MRDNVKHFVEQLGRAYELPGPVIEIGALQTEAQEVYADMRHVFPGQRYVGCDMRAGPGVDCRGDAHRLPLRDGRAGTVLLLDTLEHLHSPAVAVKDAARAVRDGGVVVLSSVMNFPIHGFPSDYWRFTPAVFNHLLGTLPFRTIFFQGDAEFPHTVIGVGARATDEGTTGALTNAVQRVATGWPESLVGGPLLAWAPSRLVLSQRAAERTLPALERGRAVSQTFRCPDDGLNRLDVKLTTLGRPSGCHVVFRLREEASQREVATYRLFAPHVIDGGWTAVPVPVQPASAATRYVLTIESLDAAPNDAIAAVASAETLYLDGQLAIDGEPTEGSLCVQVYCQAEEVAMPPLERLETGPSAELAGAARGAVRGYQAAWDQVRFLSATIDARFDEVRHDLRLLRDRLASLEETQRRALEQSTEAAAIVRAIKGSVFYRLWRRVKGRR